MKYLILSLILTGCGNLHCTHTLERPREQKFGPTELIICEPGEVLKKATPIYEPGGEKIKYVIGTCAVMGCE
jgi:hypothetical protein